MFASKTPRDLKNDPFPYVTYRDVTGTAGPQALYRSGNKVDGAGYFTKRDPRPEFDHPQHNEPNPILVEFREIEAEFWQGLDRRDTAGAWVDLIDEDPTLSKPINWGGLTDSAVTPEQIAHARRVLSRLAALGGA